MQAITVPSTPGHFFIANDEMAQCAHDLAQQHLHGTSSSFNVLQRLNDDAKLLQREYAICEETGETARHQLPVVDCLLTNFYFIQEQIQKNKELLNDEQTRHRRGLSNVSPAAICRLYELAQAMVQHTDMRLDSAAMNAFTGAYQQYRSLGIGELMLLPVLTRIALIAQISAIIGAAGSDVKATGEETWYASLWNSIHSLRMLACDTGHALIAAQSLVEKILQEDINGIYAAMDLPTKDRYRKTVLEISAAGRLTEAEVARLAIKLAADHAALHRPDSRPSHVGYYLVDRGRRQLEREAGVKIRFGRPYNGGYTFPRYLARIGWTTLLIMCLPLTWFFMEPAVNWYQVLIAMLLLPCVIQLAVALTHYLLSLKIESVLMPCMDISGEIPTNARTLVIIPSIPGSMEEVTRLANTLELHFIGNRGSNIHFGLLTDFRDADSQSTPEDKPLLECLQKQIEGLNAKYNNGDNSLFFLFHRPRTWHPNDRTWMGYERKRGKLNDLNGLLRGEAKDRFCLIVGEPAIFLQIKYVITLDADTQLPRDTASKLIGTMMHPLNQPVYDEQRQRVTEGYGVLQPRVGVDLAVINKSGYSHLFANHASIDPYTLASPDTYQDLFREGSFIGKGIYEVDTCLRVLGDCFPENRILSHDLLEGCYLRSGLVSDVCLYEDFPSGYLQDKKRHHRWIRGDWQAAAWMLPFVPGPHGSWQRNTLSGLSRWKIFDNLCRSVYPIALVGLFLFSWFVLQYPLRWTILLTILSVLPGVLIWAEATLRQLKTAGTGTLLKIEHYPAPMIVVRALYSLIWLPGEAYCAISAIGTALWRMSVSHRGLLQWDNTTRETILPQQRRLEACIMWSGVVVSTIVALCLFFTRPAALLVAAPLLAAWIFSPLVARITALPKKSPRLLLTDAQQIFLRRIVRKTWRYFETFVGPQENWLPPDHYQEYPVKRVAHWTSPTNIGLSLLAGLSAADLGYLTPGSFVNRTAKTLATLDKLERYRGHFYNWYDTITLQPARPRYVSTVDSGNLAGHLLTLRQGMLEIPRREILGAHSFRGLADTLELLIEEAVHPPELQQLTQLLGKAARELRLTWKQASDYLEELAAQMEAVRFADLTSSYWQQAFLKQVAEMKVELQLLAPWLALPPAPEVLVDLLPPDEIFTLDNVLSAVSVSTHKIGLRLPHIDDVSEKNWVTQLEQQLLNAGIHAINRVREIERLAGSCLHFADMEYDFLYDEKSKLLSIGFKPEDQAKDIGCYDLLASEARLGVFVAIAQGKLPQESWFALGRPPVHTVGSFSLLSWNGTLFEYLMPLLVMPVYDDSLLQQAMKAAVKCQVQYGRDHNIPWGISECAQNIVEASQTYQYGPVGVPDLAIKGAQEKPLVIAPYATALALTVAPEEACRHLEELYAKGFAGRFGFYEAIDYTPSRQAVGESFTVVRSFMVHHQGMSLLAMAAALMGGRMQQRFMADQELKATLLLLQEKRTEGHALRQLRRKAGNAKEDNNAKQSTDQDIPVVFNTPDTAVPETCLLSNGRYHVMVTNAGGGFSRWKNIALTRWEEDKTCDNRGMFVYLRDADSGRYWSATHQPVGARLEQYEATFGNGNAVFRGTKEQLQTTVVVAVSPEDDLEVRTITIRNDSAEKRCIEVTSYAEVVLSRPEEDAAHPAFNKLFVESEYIPSYPAIICTRRPRESNRETGCLFHMMKVQKGTITAVSTETDRMAFIGRGNTLAAPQAVKKGGLLSNSQGNVLDVVAAIRYGITLLPGEEAILQLFLGAAETREQCIEMIHNCQAPHMAAKAGRQAATAHQLLLDQLGIPTSKAALYNRLAGRMIYAGEALRVKADKGFTNRLNQSGLWKFSVSGDTPLILLRISQSSDIIAVRQLVNAHRYWKAMGLKTELVIFQEDCSRYAGFLKDHVQEVITVCKGADMINQPGGIFVIGAAALLPEERQLLLTAARIVVDGSSGLSEQIFEEEARVYEAGSRQDWPARIPPVAPPRPDGDTGISNINSAFSDDGKEYVIQTTTEQRTPAPWVNVIANPNFGMVVSESGQAYTWAGNAQLYRITSWNNDPVTDASGEVWYIRDEETGNYFSPLPQLQEQHGEYRCRHGWGYSVFEHEEAGLYTETWMYVDHQAPVKYVVLKVRNDTGRQRRLSVTGYVEWVLGDWKQRSAMHIVTSVDTSRNAIFAGNHFSPFCTDRVAFFGTDDPVASFTADRTMFIGRNASLNTPKAMEQSLLSGDAGAALDPCAALQLLIDLKPGEEREMVFMLGAGNDMTDAQAIIDRCKGRASMALHEVRSFWQRTTGCVQVRTPDPTLDVLANGWLIYQVISSRIWGRSGYYQSGGAFGFRDQLQDVMAIVHAVPEMARAQLLLHASHQFKEGDVLHWWHQEETRGVRTRCSDDLLWLPFVTCHYVQSTGDMTILDELVPFLDGRPLEKGEEQRYDRYFPTDECATLYEHCIRAIKKGCTSGLHGLPLIGTGDWNDSMNKVGAGGKGESVWLAFFLYSVLKQFNLLAGLYDDTIFSSFCCRETERLQAAIDLHAWDGEWYRRGYFDDGTPLGSAGNTVCRIDSLPQSWSVLSGAGNRRRSKTSLESACKHLVNKEFSLVQLLTPPFGDDAPYAGYINGYGAGIRENGGQYTQAAIWLMMALAMTGDSERAWEIFAMINPANRCRSREQMERYRVEPYVMAADVYMASGQEGRGGWTWYTGSAGWFYRAIVETLLGFHKTGNILRFQPCIPAAWSSCVIDYHYGQTMYHIKVKRIQEPISSVVVDGIVQEDHAVHLVDDGLTHLIQINNGTAVSSSVPVPAQYESVL